MKTQLVLGVIIVTEHTLEAVVKHQIRYRMSPSKHRSSLTELVDAAKDSINVHSVRHHH